MADGGGQVSSNRERYFISGEINTKLASMSEVPAKLAAIGGALQGRPDRKDRREADSPLQRVRCVVSAVAAGAGKTSYRAIIPASMWSSRWQ